MIVEGIKRCEYCGKDVHWIGTVRIGIEDFLTPQNFYRDDLTKLGQKGDIRNGVASLSGHCSCGYPFGVLYNVDRREIVN